MKYIDKYFRLFFSFLIFKNLFYFNINVRKIQTFAEVSKKLDTNQKIILLDYQNNYNTSKMPIWYLSLRL